MPKFTFTATSTLLLTGGLLLTGQGAAAADEHDERPDGCGSVEMDLNNTDGSFSEQAEKAADDLNDELTQDMAGNMDARTATCAEEVVRAAQDSDMDQDAATIAMSTVIVETHLNNYNGGDRDSVGLFQQRDHYGSQDERLDVGWATEAFFDELEQVYPDNSWENESMGEVAQDVQRSAYPDRYHHQVDDAETIVKHFW